MVRTSDPCTLWRLLLIRQLHYPFQWCLSNKTILRISVSCLIIFTRFCYLSSETWLFVLSWSLLHPLETFPSWKQCGRLCQQFLLKLWHYWARSHCWISLMIFNYFVIIKTKIRDQGVIFDLCYAAFLYRNFINFCNC